MSLSSCETPHKLRLITANNQHIRLLVHFIDGPRFITRTEWGGAAPTMRPSKLKVLPPPYVIIIHTDTNFCRTEMECMKSVRAIQQRHTKEFGWNDVAYNFLIGGDGSVYVARDWDITGPHTSGYEGNSLGIAFIGNYMWDSPTREQIDAAMKLLQFAVNGKKLTKDYRLLGQRQVVNTLSPGDNLYDVIKKWEHWKPTDGFTDDVHLVTRMIWQAKPPITAPPELKRLPPRYVIIIDANKQFCRSTLECAANICEIQNEHMTEYRASDIGYNFLVGGDGLIYEGRGWNVAGMHSPLCDRISIGIAFIGTYSHDTPTKNMIDAVINFLALGVKENKLAEDYKLLSQKQVLNSSIFGDILYNVIKEWNHSVPDEITDSYVEIMTRKDWAAMIPSNDPPELESIPPSHIIISDTNTEFCRTTRECFESVRYIQNQDMNKYGRSDIGYNFLVGGDGSVYEGRGWNVAGEHTAGYDRISLGIAFIGNYSYDDPTQEMVNAVKNLLDLGVRKNKLTKEYKLFGQRQVVNNPSPGYLLYDVIKKWKHWVRTKTIDGHVDIVTRTMWKAQISNKLPPELKRDPARYVVIIDTKSKFCETTMKCIGSVQGIQNANMWKPRYHIDIDYNFLVGGDGSIYEGRGWNVAGMHSPQFDIISIGIAFIGNYSHDTPTEDMIDAIKNFLTLGIKENKLAEDYRLLSHRQVMNTSNFGDKLYNIVTTWDHWIPNNITGTVLTGLTRETWIAEPPSKPPSELTKIPPSHVIISDTNTKFCRTTKECLKNIRNIQDQDMKIYSRNDIGYNFLIGGDGSIYEGRGWDVAGEHTVGYDYHSIGIAFIGNYSYDNPTEEMVRVAKTFLDHGVKKNELAKDYKLLGQRQVMNTSSPGDRLYFIIKTWDHWDPGENGGSIEESAHNVNFVTRIEWGARLPLVPPPELKTTPCPYVIIIDAYEDFCSSLPRCIKRVQDIQNSKLKNPGFSDISYNFLVGGDGSIYEGRGWDVAGVGTGVFDKISISIAFIGKYYYNTPTLDMVSAVKWLLSFGVKEKKLAKDYKLLSEKQVVQGVMFGAKLYNVTKTLEHWIPDKFTDGYAHIFTREEWAAKPSAYPAPGFEVHPPSHIIITDTNTEFCQTTRQCLESVYNIQDYHMTKHGQSDIPYNFLIGGDGSVYEGRGWNVAGNHTANYDRKSLGIAFIGNYSCDNPTKEMILAALNLFKLGIKMNKLERLYQVFGQKQVGSTSSPGDRLYTVIQSWKQWTSNGIFDDQVKIVTRAEWQAKLPDTPLPELTIVPPRYVTIIDSHTKYCVSILKCIEAMQNIQNDHMKKYKLSDIAYNFAVGGDGMIYEGRGWNFAGTHSERLNEISIGIAFIGKYATTIPADGMIIAVKKLLALGVKENKLAKDYKLLGQDQVTNRTTFGQKLYKVIKTWPHFVPDIITANHVDIMSRDEWAADLPNKSPPAFTRTPSYVIISETNTKFCRTFRECIKIVKIIQKRDMDGRGMSDIGYNFLIGGDGSVYEGRGWEVAGHHTADYNQISLGIAFIGNYARDNPTKEMINAAIGLMELGIRKNKVAVNYRLLGQRQVMDNLNPGNRLYFIIKEWNHWIPIETSNN